MESIKDFLFPALLESWTNVRLSKDEPAMTGGASRWRRITEEKTVVTPSLPDALDLV